jgi:peroxidase
MSSCTVAPVIEQDPIGEDVLAPDEVFLMCTAEGEPSPDIVWVKEETNGAMTEFSESGNGLIIDTVKSTSMSFSTLTINSADSFDTANYSCMAENLLGSTTSQPAEVTVFGE